MSGAPLSPRATATLSDFRAREEQLRRLDSQLNDKKTAVVRRAEELVKQQSERLAQMAAERSQPAAPAPTFVAPGSAAASAGLAPGQHYHHVYNESETGFLEETTGYRGKYDVPVAGRTGAAGPAARPASGSTAAAAARIQHARPVSAASQDGRRRSSGIPTPGSASAFASSSSSSAAAPARSGSAARITPSAMQSASSRPQSRTQPRGSAAPAPAAAASAYSEDDAADDGADDYTADGGAGGDDAAGGADDGGDASASDPLGYGDLPGGVSAAGMGTAATLRFQRARLKALDANVAALTASLKERDKELGDLKSLLKNGNDSREKQLRAKESLERSHAALQSRVDELQSKLTGADSKLANMDRELSAASKRKAELENEAKTRDAKLNRALAELERSKETLAARRNGAGGGGGGSGGANDELSKDLASQKLINKKLLSQRSELLAGFKKQARLIELLKRQKMHVEMAKMLQFTEDEFAKTLEMGEI